MHQKFSPTVLSFGQNNICIVIGCMLEIDMCRLQNTQNHLTSLLIGSPGPPAGCPTLAIIVGWVIEQNKDQFTEEGKHESNFPLNDS